MQNATRKQESRAVTGNYHTVWDNSTESLHLILGQVNRNKSKTIGKHGDVVKKTTLQMHH